ncbi:hypothetical protein H5410_061856 [Solanum commersonii]|uniref:Uncharacterized protein n=1 Tax=Solanum commersonii TaxID=4109 RepID=A0A9J5W959_SOLCO|nr:hypothetical protein H5410_061856 [Solanum commersonii]
MDQGECNLSLVHEFYANWNTHCVEINKGFIRDSWVRFSVEALNEFLGTPNCNNADFLAMTERPPYRDIKHTLCGVNSVAGLPVNVGAILKQNMLKFRTNKRWRFCYGSIITRYLRALLIEKEVHDVCPPLVPLI